METAELLKRRIRASQELQSVVKTMKSLAAVNIRQFEKAVEALGDYNRTIEMGLQVVLGKGQSTLVKAREAARESLTIIVIGSDIGMCGLLNDQIASHCVKTLADARFEVNHITILAVGQRVAASLEEEALVPETVFSVPGGVSEITPTVQDLIEVLDQLHTEGRMNQVEVYYNEHVSKASFKAHRVRLLPMDRRWLKDLQSREWPGPSLPMFTMEYDDLLSSLVRQYLFAGLYRALAESLASENAARLMTMQNAERNIEERLASLTTEYHQQRQTAITSEILEIVTGFEALDLPEEHGPH